MDNEIQQRIEHYLELYSGLHGKVADVQVATSIMHEVRKDTRMRQIRVWDESNGQTHGNGDQPATGKQISYMKVLGVEIPDECTNKQASKLIDGAIEKDAP